MLTSSICCLWWHRDSICWLWWHTDSIYCFMIACIDVIFIFWNVSLVIYFTASLEFRSTVVLELGLDVSCLIDACLFMGHFDNEAWPTCARQFLRCIRGAWMLLASLSCLQIHWTNSSISLVILVLLSNSPLRLPPHLLIS